jgi:error-prone DNA polymerase
VRGFGAAAAARLIRARAERTFASVQDLAVRAELGRGQLEALAAAGACATLTGNRHQSFWAVAGTEAELPLAPAAEEVAVPMLAQPTEGEDLVADYRHLGLTLGRHPLALLRGFFEPRRVLRAGDLLTQASGARVRVAGLVVTRQRPGTASGVTFVTLEDDTGNVNLIVWKQVGEAHRRALFDARLLEAEGRLQRQQSVTHVIVERLFDRSRQLGRLLTRSRDFR